MNALSSWWQTIELSNWQSYLAIGVVGVFIWALWIYRWTLSRMSRPVVNDFRASTSVVVPSYREDPEILLRCLSTWSAEKPDEIIIVLDVKDTDSYRRLVELSDPLVQVLVFPHTGKRSALGVGIRAASNDIIVLADSDTSWEPGLLAALQMPFVSPEVGAVGTQQNVYQRSSSIWRRVADWFLDLRYYDYVPAMSRGGGVICVSGRTAAYRRSAVLPVLQNLEDEFFFGRRCISGDDGRLTWLILASGYKTVHQSSARALSMFPSTFSAFIKQRVRWSRNSYRCYLTALWKGWIWRTPFISQITLFQILLTPVTMAATLGYLVFSRVELSTVGITVAVAWVLAGRGIRGISHLARRPLEIWLLPVIVLVVVLIALPVKTYAFFTMNKQGWLTRGSDTVGGEGQTAATLVQEASHAL